MPSSQFERTADRLFAWQASFGNSHCHIPLAGIRLVSACRYFAFAQIRLLSVTYFERACPQISLGEPLLATCVPQKLGQSASRRHCHQDADTDVVTSIRAN
jgi:hypothetical protein